MSQQPIPERPLKPEPGTAPSPPEHPVPATPPKTPANPELPVPPPPPNRPASSPAFDKPQF